MFYVNRTFLAIELGANNDTLRSYINSIDRSLKEFDLPVYYEVCLNESLSSDWLFIPLCFVDIFQRNIWYVFMYHLNFKKELYYTFIVI